MGAIVDRLKTLLTREQIAAKVAELGAAITRDFPGESVVLLGVLKGATVFLADLARQIQLDATFDFIGVSSYGNSREQSGERRRPVYGREEHHTGGRHTRHRPDADVFEKLAAGA